MNEKEILHRYLRLRRTELLAKLDGLDEYNVRRPLTPTGTNLLGLIKHVASVEIGYFGEVFGRPHGQPLPWLEDDAEPDADLWVTPDETRDQIVALHRTAPRPPSATPPSTRFRSTPKAWCPGGRRSAAGSPCSRSSFTCASKRPSIWAMRTSCASSSTGQPGRAPATQT